MKHELTEALLAWENATDHIEWLAARAKYQALLKLEKGA